MNYDSNTYTSKYNYKQKIALSKSGDHKDTDDKADAVKYPNPKS